MANCGLERTHKMRAELRRSKYLVGRGAPAAIMLGMHHSSRILWPTRFFQLNQLLSHLAIVNLTYSHEMSRLVAPIPASQLHSCKTAISHTFF